MLGNQLMEGVDAPTLPQYCAAAPLPIFWRVCTIEPTIMNWRRIMTASFDKCSNITKVLGMPRAYYFQDYGLL